MRKRSYLYRHIRLDTNEVFYVGIGSKRNNRNYKDKTNIYERAYSKRRNIFWKRIVSKTRYKVEILKDNISWEDAIDLECFLISIYGRRDLDEGTLVNLTDGGEGTENIAEETRNKISKALKGKFKGNLNPNYGNKWTKEMKDNMSKLKKGKLSGTNSPHWGKVKSIETRNKISKNHNKPKGKDHYLSNLILDKATGIFYFSIKEASVALVINYSTLKAILSGNRSNKTNLIKV